MVSKTVDFYNKEAKTWFDNHVGKKWSFRDELLVEFKKLLPKGNVLEIGCGPGIDARKLIDAGFDYIGIDASEEFVKLAKKINPNINFLTMPVEKLDFPKNTFDGFWTSATLLHIHKKNINIILNKIREVCKTGAIGFISLKEGEGEIEENETGRWFSFYKSEEFKKILIKNGMEIIEFKVFKDRRKNKPDLDWLMFYIKVI